MAEAEEAATQAVIALTLGAAFEEHLTKEKKEQTIKSYRWCSLNTLAIGLTNR